MTNTERETYRAERVEFYRARGEDYGTAYKWADLDVQAKYGK